MGSRGKGTLFFLRLIRNFHQVKKLSNKQKAYKEVVKARASTPAPPVQYTRRLKSRKQKKLKVIVPIDRSLRALRDPVNYGKHQFDASLICVLHQICHHRTGDDSDLKSVLLLLFSFHSRDVFPITCPVDVGDTTGMVRKDTINRMPKQGKHESDAQYLSRVHKEVEDELARIEFAKKQKVICVPFTPNCPACRLKLRKEKKQQYAAEKRVTGWEHLKGSGGYASY
ncbi:unnamed protein product [Echinostoma caproni]|uniref:60S ribosomal protein L23a n=1 Tax=Echinostoma caproni TaxID=27848 RepID=A0A183BBL4_9TREM|nr:unnamed protein product [Echinostoma caproni]